METIAVYWEPKIKTYGIAVRTGLYMISFLLPFSAFDKEKDELCKAASDVGELVLVIACPEGDSLRLHLLLEGRPAWNPAEMFSGNAIISKPSRRRVDTDVELVYFQGPHYGDRYGIADAALCALGAESIPVLAAAFTGASVYLALPKQTAEAARKALLEYFIVPGDPEA